MTQKNRILCLLTVPSTSREISAVTGIPTYVVSAILCQLRDEGKVIVLWDIREEKQFPKERKDHYRDNRHTHMNSRSSHFWAKA